MSDWDLSHLSDEELEKSCAEVAAKAEAINQEILLYLAVIEERRLYLTEGYPSMLEFCMATLGEPEDEALERLHAARALLASSRAPGTVSR